MYLRSGLEIPPPPPIDDIYANDKKITGTGDKPGNKITVTFPDGTTTAETTVKDDGTWEVNVPENIKLKEGDTVG